MAIGILQEQTKTYLSRNQIDEECRLQREQTLRAEDCRAVFSDFSVIGLRCESLAIDGYI